jgi:hypothetical protein
VLLVISSGQPQLHSPGPVERQQDQNQPSLDQQGQSGDDGETKFGLDAGNARRHIVPGGIAKLCQRLANGSPVQVWEEPVR